MNTHNGFEREHSGRWLHRFAWLTAGVTYLLVIAGALVTSRRAGLSVPDWPTTFGHFMFSVPVWGVEGPIRYEHGHRLIASTVGMLMVVLGLWLFRSERRRWMRGLGVVGIGLVIIQGVLGGLTVLHELPPLLSAAHASLAQAFFCLTITLAMATSERWRSETAVIAPQAWLARLLSLATTIAIYVQMMIGAMIRHSEEGVAAHIACGMAVLLLAAATAPVVLTLPVAGRRAMFAHGMALLVLVVSQIGLGFATLMVHLPKTAPQTLKPVQILLPTAHLAVGALVLAVSFALTLKCYRFMQIRTETGPNPFAPEVALQ